MDKLEPITLARKIQQRIDDQDKQVEQLEELANNKAMTNLDLNKQTAIKALELENGMIKEFEGIKIPNKLTDRLRTSILKGLLAQYTFEAEVAESSYKSAIVKIESIRAAMNGHQSQNRHLSEQ